MKRDELQHYARMGAQERLINLRREIATITGAFPELANITPGSVPMPVEGNGEIRPRKKYRMSAEARDAVSARMKRYWAERRKQSARQK